VVLVGYRDNSVEDDEGANRPGAGYFIFRNSWSENWAKKNDFARGYGFLPFEYLERFCLEAAVMDTLAAGNTPSAQKKPQPAHGKKPRTSRKRA
jgi:C1A family cysteine protease